MREKSGNHDGVQNAGTNRTPSGQNLRRDRVRLRVRFEMTEGKRIFSPRVNGQPMNDWDPRDDIGGSLAVLAVILAAIASGVYFLLPF